MRVTRVGRSLLKGTRHETSPDAELDVVGVRGDRELCLIDLERERVLRTIEAPELVAVRARWEQDELLVQMPDGTTVQAPVVADGSAVTDYWGRPASVTTLSSPHAPVLSAYLNRPVAVARAQRGHIIYRDGISLITTGELERLATSCGVPAEHLAARFRATFTLDADRDSRVGDQLRLGDAVVQVTQPIDRCAVVDIDADGRQGTGVLRALPLVKGAPTFGVAARVIRPGRVVSDT